MGPRSMAVLSIASFNINRGGRAGAIHIEKTSRLIDDYAGCFYARMVVLNKEICLDLPSARCPVCIENGRTTRLQESQRSGRF